MKRLLITTETNRCRRSDAHAMNQSCRRVAIAALVCAITAVIGGCGGVGLQRTPPESEPPPVVVNVRSLPTLTNPIRYTLFGFSDRELVGSLVDPLLDPDNENSGTGPASTEPIIQIRQIPEVFVNPIIESTERHFALGTVPIGAPGPNTTREVLALAIIRAGELAECFVLRQKVDWEAYRPNGTGVAELTEDIVGLVSQARAGGFSIILVEIDPIVSRVAVGPLPPALTGQNFGSPDVRAAMKRQAIEIATRVRPDYLSFSVEINGYFEADPDDFLNFVSLHQEMYDLVKAVSPETQVMASLNLEGIQGLFKGLNPLSDHGPQWFLLDLFEPKVDVFSFSTLPFPIFFRAAQLPVDYISQIGNHTDRDIVLSEVGWTTAAVANSNQQEQTDYLALMSRQALLFPQLRVMAWTIFFDAAAGSIFDVFPAFAKLGLLEVDGTAKSALSIWERLHNTPLVEPRP